MTSQGSALTRYRRALAGGNPDVVWAAAAECEYLDLLDALGLLYVLAAAGDGRFSRASGRFVARLATERELLLEEILVAVSALIVIRTDPRSQLARETLERFVRSRPNPA